MITTVSQINWILVMRK